MKFLIALALFASTASHASTQALFARDGSKASVFVLGRPGDSDGIRLFDSLNVRVEEMNGKLTKKLGYDSPAGQRVFSIVCVFSKILKENGTCTVVLNAQNGTTVDKGNHFAEFLQQDSVEAAKIGALFVMPAAGEVVYASADGRLQISVARSQGSINVFHLRYQ